MTRGPFLNLIIVPIFVVLFTIVIIKNYYSVEAFNEISIAKINSNKTAEGTLKPLEYKIENQQDKKDFDKYNNTVTVEATAPETAATPVSAGATQESSVVYYSGSKEKKQLALTFDDGPDDYYTNKILDILKKYNVKATFFVIGKNAEMHRNTLKRIEYEGHVIGSHTYSHADLNMLNETQIRSELSKTEAILDSTLGHHTKIMRPPFGNNSKEAIKTIASLGYKIVDWSVDTRDWSGASPTKIMEYIKSQVHPGAIILHHSANRVNNTLEVLPKEIEKLRSEGYEFVTIPELLGPH
ncbi:polysaccharide deacetylase family protein [Candidatus Clostridium stratigraminis]|uniref:Polysaccharide deacetylase family protein n=1 Tax=Candidatus Clostridium stratigraminis TaxID=3381661 RepID=A0ABW8T9Q1_9CLOT